jgi:hypothetical protein
MERKLVTALLSFGPVTPKKKKEAPELTENLTF